MLSRTAHNVILVIVLYTLLVMIYYTIKDTLNAHNFQSFLDDFGGKRLSSNATINQSKYCNFIVIICSRNPENGINTSKLKQLTVLLKSAAMVTQAHLRFHIVSDTQLMKESIIGVTKLWPEKYRSRLQFYFHGINYPVGFENLKNLGMPCATQRLFLHDMFPELDAAIYLDMDTLFLRPPEELWDEFQKFNEYQVAAVGYANFYKIQNLKVPYVPPGGINPGIMLMNMTRMRQFPVATPRKDGWSSAMLGIVNTYKGRLRFADMDILNIFFNQNPRLLYILDCWWTFIKSYCDRNEPCLRSMASEKRGIALIHGAGGQFDFAGSQRQYMAVFNAYVSLNLDLPLDIFFNLLKERVGASVKKYSRHCNNVKNISDLFTLELERIII